MTAKTDCARAEHLSSFCDTSQEGVWQSDIFGTVTHNNAMRLRIAVVDVHADAVMCSFSVGSKNIWMRCHYRSDYKHEQRLRTVVFEQPLDAEANVFA